MSRPKIKVLIVEDSLSVQILLEHILESDPDIEVCGKAGNGRQALSMIKIDRPDIITMDMCMPILNGEETTRIIMQTDPIPILVITASLSVKDVKNSYRALNAGALKVINKPAGLADENYREIAAQIIQDVKNLSGIKLVKRVNSSNTEQAKIAEPLELRDIKDIKIKHIAIGASTGGPPVILDILKKLPPNFNVPIYIVQHIATGFLDGFVAWLRSSTVHEIIISENEMRPQPGKIYVAASDYNTGLKANGLFELKRDQPNSLLCPSISFLFGSLSRYFAPASVGILLTGMGKDGAAELKNMREAGAITIAQNEETSVIFGMPGEAVKIGAAKFILSPDEIVKALKILIY